VERTGHIDEDTELVGPVSGEQACAPVGSVVESLGRGADPPPGGLTRPGAVTQDQRGGGRRHPGTGSDVLEARTRHTDSSNLS